MTLSQSRAHFLRQVKGRAQTGHVFSGRLDLATPLGIQSRLLQKLPPELVEGLPFLGNGQEEGQAFDKLRHAVGAADLRRGRLRLRLA